MSNAVVSRTTAAKLILLVAPGAAVVLLSWAAPAALRSWGALTGAVATSETTVPELVLLVSTAGVTGTSVWLLACVVVCVADHRRPAAYRRLRPRALQLLVAAALGSSALAPAGPAPTVAAVGPAAVERPPGPRILDGLPLPERAYGGVRSHRMTPGDSLWTVAADELAHGAPASAVATAWPRLHALNRDRIGPDPDVVRVGTRVRLPPVRPDTDPETS